MTLRINSNISAINTHRNMQDIDTNLSKSLEKLSSGLRINRASDDAAGLSIANRLLTQVNGLNQAQSNAQDGINMINVADGAMDQVGQMLQRMRELAVQAANGTMTGSDRADADAEVSALMSEIDNITCYTSFNGYTLLNVALQTFTFQIGADNGQTLSVGITGTCTSLLSLVGGGTMSVSTQTAAQNALKSLDVAIARVDTYRSTLGAASNRLQYEINNLGTQAENMKSAESQIRDVDMASEMTTMTQRQIMMQAATAMLAQANAQPQSILSLFQ